jgi:hypothetical protein
MLAKELPMLGEVVDRQTLSLVIAELEEMASEGPEVRGAIYVLKNELEPRTANDPKRTLLFDRSFSLPEGLVNCLKSGSNSRGLVRCIVEHAADLVAWVKGDDGERFRDRCDSYFLREMVPYISEHFGDLADMVLNTINEAIINYAEYSFDRWCVRRRVHVHLFWTEGDLAYVIIRPSGSRLSSFEPLTLQTREHGPRQLKKRGWGHTLLMERALFVSFDRDPNRRGMLVIVGPPSSASRESHKSGRCSPQRPDFEPQRREGRKENAKYYK